MEQSKTALLIGNSDGIGLATTHVLLAQGYHVTGLSRSKSPITHPHYNHIVQDVTEAQYRTVLQEALSSLPQLDVCIYCAGIGVMVDLQNLKQDTTVFDVNVMGAVIATEIALTEMVKRNHGHFIGLSSIMDVSISGGAPSYAASKAAVSVYWESLALALKGKNVNISNVRFGFVNTKMGKAKIRPFLLTTEKAAEFIWDVIKAPRIRATKPRIMGFVCWLGSLPIRLKLLLH